MNKELAALGCDDGSAWLDRVYLNRYAIAPSGIVHSPHFFRAITYVNVDAGERNRFWQTGKDREA